MGQIDERAWTELNGAVQQELVAWRRAHPRATLAEIEAAVGAALARVQAQYLRDLVAASPLADVAGLSEAERPRCPDCGAALAARGRQERRVLTPGQPAPLAIRRSYAVCPACGRGLFPPG
jgi:ribosomal protein S27AE